MRLSWRRSSRRRRAIASRNPLVRDPSVAPSHAVGMVTWAPRDRLLGRERERDVLDRLLETARGGEGRVLVVHGEPGVGKSALLAYAVEARPEFRVVRTV